MSRFTGGHILVIPFRWVGQQLTDITGTTKYEPTHLLASGSSWLDWFYPQFYEQGFWVPLGEQPNEFIDPNLTAELATFPGVEAVVTIPMLPVVVQGFGPGGRVDYPLRIAPLTEEIQQLTADRRQPDQFALANTGIFFNKPAPVLREKVPYQQQGEAVDLLLPQLDDRGRLDFTEPISYTLPFGAYLQVPTREVAWMDPVGGTLTEEGRLAVDIAWIGQVSWQEIVNQVSSNGAAIPISNLVLRVEDLQILEPTIAELNATYPDLTFVSLGEVEERIFHTGHLEQFSQAPQNVWRLPGQPRLTIPISFSRIFAYLLVLIAAILLGGHMLTGIASRQQEIGTLRALGARRRDIIILGFSETVALTLIGATLGFFPLRLFGVIMQLRGGQAFLDVLLAFIREYVQICGLTLAAALLFSLLPVWRLSSVAPMEVLRNE
ncbi:MAG: ABC transporter permease [Firmicutes bacterium]|nr:ABC transporter permease [Bacillota bacterium]